MATSIIPPEAPPQAPAQALTLYAVEGWVEELQDTEGVVTPEQRQAFELELTQALKSRDRTERVGQSIRQIEAAVEFGKEEIKRIRDRCNALQNVADRLREGVLGYILSQDLDGSARFPKLVGRTVTMSARSNPPSVDITDTDQVAARFKTACVEMPFDVWQVLVDAFPIDTAGALQEVKVDKRAVKAAIDKGEIDYGPGSGVELISGRYSLQVR